MPKLSSKPTIQSLIGEFKDKFDISEGSKSRFHFDNAYYDPDIVFRSKNDNRIIAIIEIDQGTRKHVVGGAITADYVCGKEGIRPVFIILGLTKQDVKDYKKRKWLIESYVKNISRVIIGDYEEVVRELNRIATIE
jgi:hypothetical protein